MTTKADLAQRVRAAVRGLSAGELEEVVAALSRLLDDLVPTRAYVFGSRATGAARNDSDVDLLLVVASSPEPAHRRIRAAYRSIGRHSIPMDIIVLTEAEFSQRAAAPSSLAATALREGVLLYAA